MRAETGTTPDESRLARLALAVFVQMLPATLVAPAVRPLFALQHAGHEGAMHAFMALNMAGAALAVPFLGGLADRLGRPRRLFALLAAADALLLALVVAPIPTRAVLLVRALEGAAHVGAATLLLAEAARVGRRTGSGRAMGVAGAALMFAIALGSGLGGLLVGVDPRLPFWGAALLATLTPLLSPFGAAESDGAVEPAPGPAGRPLALLRAQPALLQPLAAAFVERFTIGCLVVTFSLFAHREHGLSDRAVGGLFTLLTLPFALSMYPVSRLAERVPRAALLLSGGVLYGGALASLAAAPAGALPVVMLTAGLASGLIFSPTLAYAADLAGPGKRGAVMSLVNAAGCLGMLLGPAAAGITSALFRDAGDPARGYRAVFVLAAFSVAAWLVASTPWLRRQLRAERARVPAPASA